MIDRIGHINIRTTFSRYEDTLDFYERLMGLKRSEALALPGRGNAWLFADSGRAIVHVNAVDESEGVEPEDASTGRLNHVAFDCRDYDEAVSRIEAMGLEYKRYETAVDELVLLVTKDPFNNIVLELSCGVDSVLRTEYQTAA